MVYFITMNMKAKFHESCLGFICRPMACEQGYSNFEGLSPLLNEEDNLNSSNEKLFPILLSPNSLTFKGIQAFSSTSVGIDNETFRT